jgi:1-aminocyclopropane-1-carboxylate deaminase
VNKILHLAASPIEEISSDLCQNRGIRLFIKRDDLLHPAVSGNKWRKLYYNLQAAKEQGKKTLVTFGGAYSNHIHAVAAAGHLIGFQTIGLIRGEEPKKYGATLAFAKLCGMSFRFLSRSVYREKTLPVDLDLADCYILPEGGTNDLAITGCGDIVKELLEQLPVATSIHYCVSCGTGGTITGIINALEGRHQVIGFSALKGDFMKSEITSLQKEYQLTAYTNWTVNCDYHFGGYAKHKKGLLDFMIKFYKETGVALDPVYTGKMIYGVLDLVAKDYFPKGSNIVMIHTGGLQGILGFNERFGVELPGGISG